MPQGLRIICLLVFAFNFIALQSNAQCGSLAITGVTTTPVSCNGGSNGTITVQTTGGTGPFTYSNGTSTTGSALVTTQAFNSDVITSNSTTTQFYSPICNNGRYFDYSSSTGCPSGSAYFSSQAGIGFHGCFLRTPQRDASGLNTVTLRFDITNSYNSGRPLDKITFSIWINNGYRNTTIVPVTVNGVATNEMAFTVSRTCEPVEVVFNISNGTLADKSDMFLYINSSCGYSNCGSYFVALDNIEVLQGGGSSYQSSNTFTGLPAGNYNITVQDANGCTLTYGSNPVVVSQPTVLTATTIVTNPTTVGGNNGKAWATVSGGTPPYTYTWSPPASSGATPDTIVNLIAGNYSVTITDNNGCTASGVANVTNPTCTLAITSVGKVNATCDGVSNGSFTITTSGANGALEYSINGGTTWQSSNSFTALAAGNYTVRARDASGCTANASGNPQIITAPQIMNLNFATTPVSTVGGSDGAINLTVTGGNTPRTYNWSQGSATEDISGLSSGQYCVTVTDANGCTITGCGNVAAPTCNLTVTSVVVTPACGANGSITITATGSNGATQYSINGGSTWQSSGSFTGLSTGSYTVQVRDAAGCTANGPANPYNVGQAAAIGLSFSATSVSTVGGNDGSITLTVTNATSPVVYNWSNGAVTKDLSNLTAGQYCVTVSDGNGCTATGCQNVNQPGCALAITNVTKTDAACFGGSGSIAVTSSGGVGNVEYSFNGGTTWSASGTLNAVAGSYNVQVRDGNGCVVVANGNPYVIAQPTALSLSTTVVNASQSGASDGAVNLTVTGGTPAYTFSWDNSQQTQNISNLSAGTYCVTVTDANNCTANICATVTEPGNPCPGFSITNVVTTQPDCPGDNGTITISISGGQNPILYSIDSGATFQNGVSLFTVSGGSYDVLVRDNSGCEVAYSNNPVVINTPQSINPVVTANDEVLSVDNFAGATYQWLFGGNEIANADDTTYTVIANGTYSVEVTDANGCVFTSNTVNVTGVSIAEIPSMDWQVWPNPSLGSIQYSHGTTGTARMELWASDGRLVWSQAITQTEGSIDVSTLPGGIYSIRLITNEGQAQKRIIKY